jgi:hypothetical protein
MLLGMQISMLLGRMTHTVRDITVTHWHLTLLLLFSHRDCRCQFYSVARHNGHRDMCRHWLQQPSSLCIQVSAAQPPSNASIIVHAGVHLRVARALPGH